MQNKILIALLLVSCSFAAELLTPNKIIYTKEQSHQLAFEASDDGILQNPPSQKTRIYAVRAKDYMGSLVFYDIYYQYNPTITTTIKNEYEPVIEEKAYKDNLFTKLTNGSKGFKDFEVSKSLLLISQKETNSYLVFTPEAGKIYCIESSVILGLHNARPNLKLIDKQRCEKLYKEIE